MDQLQEPKFQQDPNWRRQLIGIEPLRKAMDNKATNLFYLLTGLSCLRYLREITYYRKNYLTSVLICSGFVFSSYSISKFLKEDPFVVAAEMNNQSELKYREEYKKLFLEAQAKKIEIPLNLID
jgi:hypothetical protein